MSNKGKVLQAKDNQVQGASTGQLETTTSETAATNVQAYDIPALLAEHKTKSGVIRYLNAQGLSVGDIRKMLVEAGWKSDKSGEPIRYQHVRNVLKQPVKKASTAAVAPSAPAPSSDA